MTAVTGFNAWVQGQQVPTDAHGNNVAFLCTTCRGPVLATLMEHQRGSSASKPTQCGSCGASFWIEAQVGQKRLLVHRVPSTASGRYVLGRTPEHTSGPNIASWNVISALLNAYGGAEYEDLAAAVRQHDHPAGGKAFIDYCIRKGWLKRA